MNYTCPKCGKKMDLSTEVLINSEYKVICPQCLSELHIVGDYAYIPHDSLNLDTSVGGPLLPQLRHQLRLVGAIDHRCGYRARRRDRAAATPAQQ